MQNGGARADCGGHARKEQQEVPHEAQGYLRFLRIARGSAYELETQLVLAEDLGLCPSAKGELVVAALQEVIRVLNGLIAAVERKAEG